MMHVTQGGLRLLLCQDWVEYERGWGSRPDGCTLHRTQADHRAFCQEYWAQLPKGNAPDEYAAESGKPYLAVVDATLYGRVCSSVRGIWVSATDVRSGLVRPATPDEILSNLALLHTKE